jgi:zinc transport system substrate-binding protein
MRRLGVLAKVWAAAAVLVALVSAPSRAADLNVVATIKPIHSIAAAVMEGVAEPHLLIDGMASPHTYSLKPSDTRVLNAANVVFRVSDGLEPFMGKVARSLPKKVQVVELEKAPGLVLYKMRGGGTFETHSHGGKKGKHSHAHSHNHADDKNATDSHIWLDPANAARIAAHMADVLAKAHPAGADRFKANAAAFGQRMVALGDEIAARMKPFGDSAFIVFHDAYQYFEERFGLDAAGSVTVSPEVAPSAKRLTALRRKIADLKAVCVFAEPQFEPKLVVSITEGTKARRGTLDPNGAAIPAGPGHYEALLRAMAADFEACLK